MSDAYGDMPDISQLTPATGRVGQPQSGTYGEAAALNEVEAALPAPTGAPAGPGMGAPSPSSGPLPLAPPSGALPRSLMPGKIMPSTRPQEPLSTPLTQPIPVGETPSAQKVQLLQAWARDATLSETTRVWAQSILASLGQQ